MEILNKQLYTHSKPRHGLRGLGGCWVDDHYHRHGFGRGGDLGQGRCMRTAFEFGWLKYLREHSFLRGFVGGGGRGE